MSRRALSPRQREVLELKMKGLTYQEIGLRLEISNQTVKNHFYEAYNRLGLEGERRRPYPAIVRAARTGQISLR